MTGRRGGRMWKWKLKERLGRENRRRARMMQIMSLRRNKVYNVLYFYTFAILNVFTKNYTTW